jgi:hypothetical protein
MITLTPEQLAELERLEAAATAGEWRSMREVNQYIDEQRKLVGASRIDGIERPWNARHVVPDQGRDHVCRFIDADADFIAAIRNAAKPLIEEVKRLRDDKRLVQEQEDVASQREIAKSLRLENITLRQQLAESKTEIERLNKILREYATFEM